jgi:hypothetical protein
LEKDNLRSKSSNRRCRTRIVVSVTCSVKSKCEADAPTEAFWQARMDDLTLKGCRLCLPPSASPEPGTRLTVLFPPLDPPLPEALSGNICWVQRMQDETCVGLKFEPYPRAAAAMLDKFLQVPGSHVSREESHRYRQSRRRIRRTQSLLVLISVLVAVLFVLLFSRASRWMSGLMGENRVQRRAESISDAAIRKAAEHYKEKIDRNELTKQEIEELKRYRDMIEEK